MKTPHRWTEAMLLLTVGLAPALAQFDAGSDGSDGALNVTVDTTLDLPSDGIYHYTTVTVAANTTLRFNSNLLNTPVRMLATGDVLIHGTIDISGEDGSTNPPRGGAGGPGGYKGGEPGINGASIPPGAGEGPGAGRGGNAAFDAGAAGGASFAFQGGLAASTNNGSVYGSPLLIPIIGGSGGGGAEGSPGRGGGGGGGALLIASDTRIVVDGAILAEAGQSTFNRGNHGSGGAIRLVAPEVSGTGTLDVENAVGAGRIRIDALDRSGVDFTFNPPDSATLGVAMIAIADPLPRLDLIEVAGTPIAEGTNMPVTVTLPFGSNPTQDIVVQARDFNAQVPVALILTPEHGDPPSPLQAVIDNVTSNPAQTTLTATFPTNIPTTVHVFTR